MANSKIALRALAGVATLSILAACGGSDVDQPIASECVPMGDVGSFYVVDEDGLLRPADRPEAEIRVMQAPKGWAQDLEGSFPGMGFPWMKMDVKGEVATLVGLAPTQEAKNRGFEGGKVAILADAKGGKQITIVANGIAVEGGEAGVGEALSQLSDRPSLAACQRAFKDTMQGRKVQFRTSSATIRRTSAQLLDAVTGVGLFCKDYQIEVGGHTDVRGSQAANQKLSEDRAAAVKAYLVDRGVPEDRLTAVGYGSTKPLDPADTLEAYSKNRRTEFIVRNR